MPDRFELRVLKHRSALAITIVLIDRKSTRLNSSHLVISYAVFCLKKTVISRHFVRGARFYRAHAPLPRLPGAAATYPAVTVGLLPIRPLCRHFAAFLFIFNDTATTEFYTLSLHDALPI